MNKKIYLTPLVLIQTMEADNLLTGGSGDKTELPLVDEGSKIEESSVIQSKWNGSWDDGE